MHARHPGDDRTWGLDRCTATHTVTQTDLDASSFTNVAVGDSDQTPPGTAEATTPITATPALDVVKTVTSTGPYDSIGDVITYAITVTNTGNRTLTGGRIGEVNPRTIGPCIPGTPATLAPGASLVCQATHVLTQGDIDLGRYTNIATADSNETDRTPAP